MPTMKWACVLVLLYDLYLYGENIEIEKLKTSRNLEHGRFPIFTLNPTLQLLTLLRIPHFVGL